MRSVSRKLCCYSPLGRSALLYKNDLFLKQYYYIMVPGIGYVIIAIFPHLLDYCRNTVISYHVYEYDVIKNLSQSNFDYEFK